GRAAPVGGQGEQYADAVDRVPYHRQVDREPVDGGRLPGHLDPGQRGRARVGDGLGARYPPPLVAEGGGGEDRMTGRDPDLQAGVGQGVVLPPDQLGGHRARLSSMQVWVGGAVRRRRSYRTGKIAGIRSWKVRPLAGLPMAVICQPAPARWTLAMI